MKHPLPYLLAAVVIIGAAIFAAQAFVFNRERTAPATPQAQAENPTSDLKAPKAERGKEANWLTDHKKAVELSKKTGKPILFDFTGSDWCPPCKALEKKVFQSVEFKKYSDEKLILLKLDFPNKGNQSSAEKEQNGALAKQHKVQGFPTIILLDPEGKLLGSKVGYGNTPPVEYLKWLDSIQAKATPPAPKADAKQQPPAKPKA
jgi:thioredoxin-related protein